MSSRGAEDTFQICDSKARPVREGASFNSFFLPLFIMRLTEILTFSALKEGAVFGGAFSLIASFLLVICYVIHRLQ